MNNEEYNALLKAIKIASENRSDAEQRKKTLEALKVRIVADYDVKDADAIRLLKKIPI